MGSPVEEFGPYLVYEQLGIGGMASVHRAETRGVAGFRKAVALKRMLPSVAGNEEIVRSFVREAHLASHLRHANVAQTYELGKVGDIYFIAMELVPGRTLRDILERSVQRARQIPLPIVLNIVNQICDALDYAHNLCDETGTLLGIVHRDVSPSNVIVSEGGVVKLIDFGIAKATALGMQTVGGMIKGKFAYIAPEYLLGSIDARADLFAIGVLAYELLTNRPLFKGRNDLDTLERVRSLPVPPPSRLNPEVPPQIDHVVMTALERDPEQRWQRATALRTAMTTETKRLGMLATNQAVVEYVTMMFEDSDPEIALEPATMPRGSTPDSDEAKTTIRPSAPQLIQRSVDTSQPHVVPREDVAKTQVRDSKQQPRAAPTPTPESRAGVWIGILLVVLAAAAIVVVYFATE